MQVFFFALSIRGAVDVDAVGTVSLIVRGTGMLGARARDVDCPNKRAQCVSLGIQVVEEQHVRANEVRREVVIQGCKCKKEGVIVIVGYLMESFLGC